MTKDETKTFLETIIGMYPNFQYLGTPTLNAWLKKLENVSMKDAEIALERYFEKGEEYPPNLVKLVKLLPKSSSTSRDWVYERDQYGFEYVVKVLENGDTIRVSIQPEDNETYRDKEGRLWAIN